MEIRHYCFNLLTSYIKQLDPINQQAYANWALIMSYRSCYSNYLYLFLAMLANGNPPIIEYLLHKKTVGRIMDVFMSSTGFTTQQN